MLNKTKPIRRATILILCSLLVTQSVGCTWLSSSRLTDNRTGTINYHSKTDLLYIDNIKDPKDQFAGIAIAALAPLAIDLALDFAENWVRDEAKKYATSYSSNKNIYMSGHENSGAATMAVHTLETGGAFIFVRTFTPKDSEIQNREDIKRLPSLADEHDNIVKKLETHLGLVGKQSESLTGYLNNLETSVPGATTRLGLLLVGRIAPTGSGEAFELQVSGYYYPALAIKATDTNVSSWDKIQSNAIVSLNGPQSTVVLGDPYSVSHAFKLKFDVKTDSASAYQFIDLGKKDKRLRSKPILVPRTSDAVLTVTLTETSNFKEVLEKIADEIGKLESKEVLGKLGG